jgi:thiol-disulfide isomerase/thioredoxin
MAKKSPITVFKHDSCGGCKEILPLIRKLAKKKGIPVKVIDVDKCKDKKKCDGIHYVPYLEYRGKEIKTSKELAEVLGVSKKEI